METLFYRCKILIILLCGLIIGYITFFYYQKTFADITIGHTINIKNIDMIRNDLNLIFADISEKTNADIVWINIFHQNPELGFAKGIVSKESILVTSLHQWIASNHKIQIKLNKNQPITELPQIDEILAGKCMGTINSSPNPYELSEVAVNRLIVHCPLYDDSGNIIGIYGLSFFDFDYLNKDQFVLERSKLLQTYRNIIFNTIFK